MAETTASLSLAREELVRLRERQADLEAGLSLIRRHANVQAVGSEFVQTVDELLRGLPQRGQLEAARAARNRLVASTSDANLRIERQRAEPGEPDTERDEQRRALARLDELQTQLLDVLREAESAQRALERQGVAARDELNQLSLWIPSAPSLRTVSGLGPAIAWTVSPEHWRGAGRALANAVARAPLAPVGGVALVLVLYALRGRFRNALRPFSPTAGGAGDYSLGRAGRGIARTAVLALPGPVLLWGLGTILASAPEAEPFTRALAEALRRISPLLLALSAFAWLLDGRGMAVRHFGWDEAATGFARLWILRFSQVAVPLMFVAALNGRDPAPYGNRESLARLAFNVAMLALALLMTQLARPGSPLIRRLFERAPQSWAARLHIPWLVTLVLFPVGIGALVAAGYFVAGGYFFNLSLKSAFLALAALVLYGIVAQWVEARHETLAAQGEARAPGTRQGGAGAAAGPVGEKAAPPALDLAALSAQTRSLLDLPVTLLLVAGLWWIWKDALPLVSVVSDFQLWTYTTTVNGKEHVHPMTVGALFLAVVVAVVTTIAVRDIGALLDTLLLRRLSLRTDATYAIKVVARYLIVGAGVVVAVQILGVGWSDVQWLVAALGVGLGFGLQEIVANFVSGLIVLAERPVRIGDQVSVGDVTGTVAQIRARATVVVDGENREVIIPNKSLITDKVVNWTLTSEKTRLVLKIGVAYGSDIALLQRLLLDVVRGHPAVAADPPPAVVFVDFGDSSLDFEIRVHLDRFGDRTRVRHEVHMAVERVLRENGIEIPFPQRDLHIRSAPGLVGRS